jgi:hypothetical protein
MPEKEVHSAMSTGGICYVHEMHRVGEKIDNFARCTAGGVSALSVDTLQFPGEKTLQGSAYLALSDANEFGRKK